jgi:hypothetical protein
MLFKNITKKRDVKEKVFRATQPTFITDLRTYIVDDLKKLTCSRTVVSIHRHWHAWDSCAKLGLLIQIVLPTMLTIMSCR